MVTEQDITGFTRITRAAAQRIADLLGDVSVTSP
jgi:hypothetical protein